MAEIEVRIYGRSHLIGCDDEQEPLLRAAAELFATRVEGVARQVGQVGEARLLIMAGLQLASELKEALPDAANGAADGLAEEAVADMLERLADQVESLADRFEGPREA